MLRTSAIEKSRFEIGLRQIAPPLVAAGLMALAGQVRVPIPGSPVPMTLQVIVMLLAGGFLAPWAAATGMLLFATAGLLGAPLFQGGGAGLLHLAGPTGGYIVGFIAGAFCCAWLLDGKRASLFRTILSMAAGVAVVHLCGMLQLAVYLGGDFGLAFRQGVLVFLPLDLVKIAVAAPIVSGVAAITGARDARA